MTPVLTSLRDYQLAFRIRRCAGVRYTQPADRRGRGGHPVGRFSSGQKIGAFAMNTPELPFYGWNTDMPMSLLDKIRADLKQAMLQKKPEVRNTLRQIMAEFPKLTVPLTLESGKKSSRLKKPEEITDEDILDIIRGLTKSERILLDAKKEPTSEYLQILETYLPGMVGREEIERWIRENIDLAKFKSPLQAMGPVMKHFGKLADGNLVRELLQAPGERKAD
jgi:uncharacterized protein YqeY